MGRPRQEQALPEEDRMGNRPAKGRRTNMNLVLRINPNVACKLGITGKYYNGMFVWLDHTAPENGIYFYDTTQLDTLYDGGKK